MGKPRDGKELKVAVAFKIEPSVREKIIIEYGSITAWANDKIKKDKKLKGGK